MLDVIDGLLDRRILGVGGEESGDLVRHPDQVTRLHLRLLLASRRTRYLCLSARQASFPPGWPARAQERSAPKAWQGGTPPWSRPSEQARSSSGWSWR